MAIFLLVLRESSIFFGSLSLRADSSVTCEKSLFPLHSIPLPIPEASNNGAVSNILTPRRLARLLGSLHAELTCVNADGPMSPMASRHEEHYFEDGNVVILVRLLLQESLKTLG